MTLAHRLLPEQIKKNMALVIVSRIDQHGNFTVVQGQVHRVHYPRLHARNGKKREHDTAVHIEEWLGWPIITFNSALVTTLNVTRLLSIPNTVTEQAKEPYLYKLSEDPFSLVFELQH